MTVYSPAQVYDIINQVHRKHEGRDISAIAGTIYTGIVLKESGGDSAALNPDDSGSRSRGWWQIRQVSHPDVTDAMAFDPLQSTEYVYRLTDGFDVSVNALDPWTGPSPSIKDAFTRNENTQQALAAAAATVYQKDARITNVYDDAADVLGRVRNTLDVIQREAGVSGGSSWLPNVNFPDPTKPLKDAAGAVVDTVEDAAGAVADVVSGPLAAISSLINVVMNPDFWKRIGLGALGLTIVLVAIGVYVSNQTPAGRLANE